MILILEKMFNYDNFGILRAILLIRRETLETCLKVRRFTS